MKKDIIKEFKADMDGINKIRAEAVRYADAFYAYATLLDEVSERDWRLKDTIDDIDHDAERLIEDYRILLEILGDC